MVQQEERSCVAHTYQEPGAYKALGDINGEKWDASSGKSGPWERSSQDWKCSSRVQLQLIETTALYSLGHKLNKSL